jgi:hypothetical protein
VRKKLPWKPFALGSVLLDLETCLGAGLPVREVVEEEDGIPVALISEEVTANRDRKAEEDEEDEEADFLAAALARAP